MRGNVIATIPGQQHVAELHIQGAVIAKDCADAIAREFGLDAPDAQKG